MNLKEKIKLRKKQILYKFPKLKKKRIFVFSMPTHGNLGDQAIAIAEKRYIKDILFDYQIVEIPDFYTRLGILRFKRKIRKNDLIFIHGGGNFGTIYPGVEADRRAIINSFPENPIIQFPQSVYFSNDSFGEKSYKESYKTMVNHKNITLVARDSESLNKLKKMFQNTHVKILYSPDMVFYLNKVSFNNIVRNNKILFILRNDSERKLSDNL